MAQVLLAYIRGQPHIVSYLPRLLRPQTGIGLSLEGVDSNRPKSASHRCYKGIKPGLLYDPVLAPGQSLTKDEGPFAVSLRWLRSRSVGQVQSVHAEVPVFRREPYCE